MKDNKMDVKRSISFLTDFINRSPDAFHATARALDYLNGIGFKELKEDEQWQLEQGAGYYISRNGSSFIAFKTGSARPWEKGFRLVASHTDSPGLRLKPYSAMKGEGNTVILNTEVYGSPVLHTWFDRPLGISGRIVINHSGKKQEHLLNIKEAVAQIPGLPIHLNRDVNSSLEIKPDKDLYPVFALGSEGKDPEENLRNYLASSAGVSARDIIVYEMSLYELQEPVFIGDTEEMLSAPRIDNLQSLCASIYALDQKAETPWTSVIAAFDNEEVGSATVQGADSAMLSTVLERICIATGGGREEFFRAKNKSFLISADCAHAVHPVHSDRYDSVNKPVINGGPVVKISAKQSYISTAGSVAFFTDLCEKAGIPYQIFTNRSDQKGGTTIGPVSATQLDIQSVDVGIPILAMHAAREMCGTMDHVYLLKVFQEFFNSVRN